MKRIKIVKQNMYMIQCGGQCACDMGMSQQVIKNKQNKDNLKNIEKIDSYLINRKN